jgi:hypothetical protein
MSWRRHKEQAPGESFPVTAGASVGPRLVKFADARDGAYFVHDLADGRTMRVPKRFAEPERFPPAPASPQRGSRLLRLSRYALVLAFVGGAGGVLVGVPVALCAAVQLGRFKGRVRRWRRRSRGWPEQLPPMATAERLRLLAALGQGGAATLIGGGIGMLLLPHLLRALAH